MSNSAVSVTTETGIRHLNGGEAWVTATMSIGPWATFEEAMTAFRTEFEGVDPQALTWLENGYVLTVAKDKPHSGPITHIIRRVQVLSNS